MKILYIDHYAGSLSLGMEFRPYYFAKKWNEKGHSVMILAANFSHLRNTNPIINDDLEIHKIDGVKFQFIKTVNYIGNGIKRAVSIFQFCIKLIVYAKRIVKNFNPDVVISSSTYPLDSFPAKRISKISRCKYIHETHDLWPLTLIEIGGMNRFHPFVLLMSMAEKYAYSKSDLVVGLFPNAAEYMINHGLQNRNKYVCIPNGIVLDEWNTINKLPNEYRDVFNVLKQNKKTIVEYAGGHAISNALEYFIDAGKLFKEEDKVVLVLIGDGTEKESLIKRANNCANIVFLPRIEKELVPSVLNEADLLYVGGSTNKLYKYGVSLNKVYDYMMAGKPIIYGIDSINNDVERFECGITIKPSDACEIYNAILKLKNTSNEKLIKMGENGKNAVINNYSYAKLSDIFLDAINKTEL